MMRLRNPRQMMQEIQSHIEGAQTLEMPLDGNCFFHSLSRLLAFYGITVDHETLRRVLVATLRTWLEKDVRYSVLGRNNGGRCAVAQSLPSGSAKLYRPPWPKS